MMTRLDPAAAGREAIATGRLRHLRLRAGMSLDETARCIGVDRMTLWRWETGRSAPSPRHARSVADLLPQLEAEAAKVGRGSGARRRALTVGIPQSIVHSPALWTLADDLADGSGIAAASALGYLVGLWSHAAGHAPDGDLSGMDWRDVEDAAGWAGEPRRFYDAAVHAGFIEEGDGTTRLGAWRRTQRRIRVGVPEPRRAVSGASNATEATPTPTAPPAAADDAVSGKAR